MTATLDAPAPTTATTRAGPAAGAPWELLVALAPATTLALFWRAWQQLFAFDQGLDATQPGFTTHWLSIAAFNVTVVPLGVVAWYGWLWRTAPGRTVPAAPGRPEALAGGVAPGAAAELRRIWVLWLHLAAIAVAAYWGGSFFAEQDAAWHQVTLRDTAFTPSHVALFYGAFPLILYTATGAYLYARTRLPHLYGGRRFPLSFGLVIAGALLLLFQVAFNEFGHTFWEPEEIFSAPLHWPFVLFAYLLGGVLAVFFQTLPRVAELLGEEPPAERLLGEEPRAVGVRR